MSENIDQLRIVLGAALEAANAQQRVSKVDWKLALKQLVDIDAAEAQIIAKDFEALDLNDDAIEALVEGYVHQGADYADVVLRLIRIFLPKKQ